MKYLNTAVVAIENKMKEWNEYIGDLQEFLSNEDKTIISTCLSKDAPKICTLIPDRNDDMRIFTEYYGTYNGKTNIQMISFLNIDGIEVQVFTLLTDNASEIREKIETSLKKKIMKFKDFIYTAEGILDEEY